MTLTPEQERDRNAEVWASKPLLRDVYHQMYERIVRWLDASLPGKIVEVGGGVGNFGAFANDILVTDRLFAPWLDMACDAYRLPIRDRAVSHLVLFDVFHHLSSPAAFFDEAARVLSDGGRLIVLDPYISAVSSIVYGLFHDEPIGWRAEIETTPSGSEYAAQGNATRFLFRDPSWLRGWRVIHREAFAGFAYLLSGGFSRPAFYPRALLRPLNAIDRALSVVPQLFAARCLVVLERTSGAPVVHSKET